MGDPTKDYRVRIAVKLSEGILPVPALTKEELAAHLEEHLRVGDADSPIVSVSVGDPSDRKPRKRY